MLGEDFQVSMNVLKKEGIETHSEVLDFKINWSLCKQERRGLERCSGFRALPAPLGTEALPPAPRSPLASTGMGTHVACTNTNTDTSVKQK